jgi:hypothetical protein
MTAADGKRCQISCRPSESHGTHHGPLLPDISDPIKSRLAIEVHPALPPFEHGGAFLRRRMHVNQTYVRASLLDDLSWILYEVPRGGCV